jgi:hypothetical protein
MPRAPACGACRESERRFSHEEVRHPVASARCGGGQQLQQQDGEETAFGGRGGGRLQQRRRREEVGGDQFEMHSTQGKRTLWRWPLPLRPTPYPNRGTVVCVTTTGYP